MAIPEPNLSVTGCCAAAADDDEDDDANAANAAAAAAVAAVAANCFLQIESLREGDEAGRG